MSDDRYAIPFDELGARAVELVGGKCAHLGDLTQGRLPRPAGLRGHDAPRSTRSGSRRSRSPGSEATSSRAVPCRSRWRCDRRRVRRTRRRPAGRRPLERVAEDSAGRELRRRAGHVPLDPRADAGARRRPPLLGELLQRRGDRVPGRPHGITRGGMSVAVQYMVDARVAGVMFTLNPVIGDPLVDRDRRELRPRHHGRRRRGDARLASSSRR